MTPDEMRNLNALLAAGRRPGSPNPTPQQRLADALLAHGAARAASYTRPDRRRQLAEALLAWRPRHELAEATVTAATLDPDASGSTPTAYPPPGDGDPGNQPAGGQPGGPPPTSAADPGPDLPPGTAIPSDGVKYKTLKAQSFDPARSNGDTALASPEVRAAAQAAINQYRVRSGRDEKLGALVPDANGALVYQEPPSVRPGSTRAADTAQAAIPANARAVAHGHIEHSTDPDSLGNDGMVDNPDANHGYGDTESLSRTKLPQPIPTATEYGGQIGWHELNNGQLQYTYPEGSMTRDQEWQMQQNLNREQELFLKPKQRKPK